MKKKKNLIESKMINIRINPIVLDNYRVFCEKNGYSVSKRIRILIENDMKL